MQDENLSPVWGAATVDAASSKQIFDSSDKIKNARKRLPKYNWPWESLIVGKSFIVPFTDIKLQTLRPICSVKGREFDPRRRFIVAVHDDCYEVARVE